MALIHLSGCDWVDFSSPVDRPTEDNVSLSDYWKKLSVPEEGASYS